MEKNILYNNIIYDWIYKIVYMIYASMLWIVFCLPVVTVGASTTALYYVANKTIRCEKGKIFQGFWYSFKMNFKQSTVIWLGLLMIYAVGFIDYFVLRSLNLGGKIQNIFVWMLILFLMLIAMIANYIFPYIARFENKTSQIIKNSILIAMMNFGKSFINIILLLLTIMICVLRPYFIIICPATYMLVLSSSLEKVFRKYMLSENLEEEDT